MSTGLVTLPAEQRELIEGLIRLLNGYSDDDLTLVFQLAHRWRANVRVPAATLLAEVVDEVGALALSIRMARRGDR